MKLAGMIFDAGPANSPALLQVGACRDHANQDLPALGSRCTSGVPSDPTLVQDVFFRIGGATPGKATNSLVVNICQDTFRAFMC